MRSLVGNLLSITDAEGNVTTYTYDAWDRLTSVANFIDEIDPNDDHSTPGVTDVVPDDTYDEDDRLETLAATIDGTADFFNTYTYNGRDFVTSVEQIIPKLRQAEVERAGVSPTVAQKLARHSDINTTMSVYTHLGMEDQTAAVERPPDPPAVTNANRATLGGSENFLTGIFTGAAGFSCPDVGTR